MHLSIFTHHQEVVVSATTIGTPVITEHYDGLYLNLEQIENALYTLAAMSEESDWDGIAELIKTAQTVVTEGRGEMASLANSLLSRGLSGSYTAKRDELNTEFNARGGRSFMFEHNAYTMRQSALFRNIEITIYPAGPEMYRLVICSRSHAKLSKGLDRPLHQLLSEALGVSQALKSVGVITPLQTLNDETRYRVDFTPFADAARASGLRVAERSLIKDLRGADIADILDRWARRCQSSIRIHPQIELVTPERVKTVIGLSYECELVQYDLWTDPACSTTFTREDTVFTGKVSPSSGSDRSKQPTLYFDLGLETDLGPSLMEPTRKLAKTLANNIVDLHT